MSDNKFELNTLTQVNNNEQNFLNALNLNLQKIQKAINDTLSRTGVVPNQMEQVLDMNGNRIVNVGKAVEPTDVVTKQDIQDIIDRANAAIAQLDTLVEAAKNALVAYAEEYIYPTVTEAVDKTEAAQAAAEAARDALLLSPEYQKLVANLNLLIVLADNAQQLLTLADNMAEILVVANDIEAVCQVAAQIPGLKTIADNLEELLKSSVYAQQAAAAASTATTKASEASTSASTATAKASEATASANTATSQANLARTSATEAQSSASTALTAKDSAETWAEGSDSAVASLGGTRSAKGWAEYAEQIISGSGIVIVDATETEKGIAMLATEEEALTGHDDSKIVTPLKAHNIAAAYVGETNVLSFNATLSGGVLTYVPTEGAAYALKDGYEYTVDMLFEAAGDLDPATTMVIHNGADTINIVNALSKDPSTAVTVENMEQVSTYSTAIGWHHNFKATYYVDENLNKILKMDYVVASFTVKTDGYDGSKEELVIG